MGIPKLRSRLIKLGGIQKRMRSTESRQAYTKTMRLPANLPMLPECLSPFLTLNSNSALVPFRRGSCRRNRGRLDARAALRVPGQRGTGDVGRATWDGQCGTGNVGRATWDGQRGAEPSQFAERPDFAGVRAAMSRRRCLHAISYVLLAPTSDQAEAARSENPRGRPQKGLAGGSPQSRRAGRELIRSR